MNESREEPVSVRLVTAKVQIERAIIDSCVDFKSVTILPVSIQIESWYFAGLDERFPYFLDKDNADLTRLLRSKTSNRHSKKNFYNYVDLNKMIGAKDIAQAVAEYFNEEKSVQYSASFKAFNIAVNGMGLY